MANMVTPMGPRATRASSVPGNSFLMIGDTNQMIAKQGYGGFPSHHQRVPTPQRSPVAIVDGVAGDLGPIALVHPVVVQRFHNTRHLLPVAVIAALVILVICGTTMGFQREQVDPVTGAKVTVVDSLKIIYAILFSLGGASLVVLMMIGYEHIRAM